MAGITIDARRFQEDLSKVDWGKRRDVLVKAGLEGVEPFRVAAGRKAPVETGALSEDIQKQEDKKLSDENTVTIDVASSKKTFYGAFQEWGTARHPPHPFMQPALDETDDEVQAGLVDALDRAIAQAL